MPVCLKISLTLILLWGACFALHSAGEQVDPEEARITALLEKIENENRYVEDLLDNNLTNLPVGIRRTISNVTITIAIDSARIGPGGMIIDAYTQLILPFTTKKTITFALRGAILTPSGISPAGPTRLEVIGDFNVPINSQVTMHIPANGRNFIDWDCTGFRSVNLSGLFEFSSEFFLPDDPNDERVTAAFEFNTSDLNNILVSTSITPFRIRGLGDMSFIVRKAVADMSDFVNGEGFAMPAGYRMIFPEAPQLWRGFFLQDLIIRLPSELGGGNRTEIAAKDILIDEFGLSGRFSATDVLSIDKGDASGWPFSVSFLEIGLFQNRVAAGEVAGLLGIPFLGDKPFAYSAQVISGEKGLEYNFLVETTGEEEYPVPFGGKVILGTGCRFMMHAENGKLVPSALINGILSLKDEDASIDGLRFEQLYIVAESPYIKGGIFETTGGAGFNIAGFGLSVDSITLGFSSGKALLALNAKVALMNTSDKGVSASTRMIISASAKMEPGASGTDRLKWSYDGILLEGVKIKGGVSLFSLNGTAFIYRNHRIYGNGFAGQLEFTAGKIIEKPVEAEVRFGSKEDFRYWFARVNVPANISIGAVTLNRIGGGAYSNMEIADLSQVQPEYIPKKDAGLGMMADVGMHIKTKKVFNADVELEIATNKSGGVKYIRFAGEGEFLSGEDKESSLVKMNAAVSMIFDNVNDSFHANLSVFLNVANAIRGRGPDDLLGEAVIHSDPSDWYVYIGRPSCPLGIDVLGLSQAQTYFMAGTQIESMPLPPSEVASIMSNLDTDFMKNERGVASGRGMAFGVMFKATAGIGMKEGFVYAYFNAGAGADIMLQDYGEARCEGRSGPIGINGWYASGQGYAYLMGKIGIRVKSAEFDIMSVAAALLVQAKMPNPAWFRGSIAARYSILGGLIRGKVNVTVVLGEECVPVYNASPLDGIKLIGDISPAGGSSDVDVFSAPQVSFNTTIGKEFSMTDLNDVTTSYRVILDKFEVRTSSNVLLNGAVEWNPAGDMATLRFRDILPGKQKINATVSVHIEKRTGGVWKSIDDGSQSSSISFTTGEEPKSIAASHVAYSYPLRNQYNFYRNEYPKGYIRLKSGLPNLFKPYTDGIQWSYLACFKGNGHELVTPAVYNENTSTIEYAIPAGLKASSVYELKIIKKAVSGGVDQNIVRSAVDIATENPLDSLRVARTEISSTEMSDSERELHSFAFRTSMYGTFGEKMGKITNWSDQFNIDGDGPNSSHMSLLFIRGTLDELFDKYEIGGPEQNSNPLIEIQALRSPGWINDHIYPLIYDQYGRGGITLDRDINVLGLFPAKAVFISNINSQNLLLDNSGSVAYRGDFYFKYFIARYVSADFYELRNKAASLYIDSNQTPSQQAVTLLLGQLRDLTPGKYPFRIRYMLPGGQINTFSKDYAFVNN